MSRESAARTLLVAVAVALACSAMVATAVHLLRPVQQAYAQIDRNRAVLDAAGVAAADADDGAVVAAFLKLDVRIVDLASGALVDAAPVGDPRSYDHWAVTDTSPAVLRTTDAAQTPPGAARYVPIYLVWRDDVLERLVLPVHGRGMWSTIYAYLALHGDLTTVAAFRIYRQGETPGIGDRIEDPEWLARWSGKRLFDDAGTLRFDIVRNPAHPQFEINLISGASVTSGAVGSLVRDWLGPRGYGPLLDDLRQGHVSIAPP